ncbi:NAD-dependent epimerase/dehydratase family protein [Nonlabens antarcticus]|uniref:NAD-dependent epimerase/dehydratase family protein n=1 Tax=Nonlabens antarcticus TaxID=392714 RepID=UPI001891C32F|nr:NAD-dependent epimerase/dehydratase family protein [Nonlabens antarcticus]
MKILVTGAAGFIGYHLCEKLISLGHEVVGLDNINDYYDVDLKYARLNELGIIRDSISFNNLVDSTIHGLQMQFVQMNLQDEMELPKIFADHKFDIVCNLAAQAGVRYSIEKPMKYVESNIVGFVNLLECIRNFKVKKLIYASSSSVYGMNVKVPFSTDDNVDHPISMYAATKKSNELMAHTYSHLFGIETIGLRFFTVYGPWGRPDMAIYLFADAISKGNPIKVFNNGKMSRDFTYIDDIVNGIQFFLAKTPNENSLNSSNVNYKIFNIGNGNPQSLTDFISAIEFNFSLKSKKDFLSIQDGDVPHTWADISQLEGLGYNSTTGITEGIQKFAAWYKRYHHENN